MTTQFTRAKTSWVRIKGIEMNAQKFLKQLQDTLPHMLEGAVEYAYQCGDISDSEYRTWNARIIEIERQKTNKLLAMVA